MDPWQWGSPFPSSSNFSSTTYSNSDAEELYQTTNFTDLLMHGMGAMHVNNTPAFHGNGHEEISNSNSRSIMYTYAMADGNTTAYNTTAYPPRVPQDVVAESRDIVTNIAHDQHLRLTHDAVVYALEEAEGKRPRLPYHTSSLKGPEYVDELLEGRDERFYNKFGMPKDIFRELCCLMVSRYGWVSQSTDGVRVEESLAMFIHVLRGNTITEIDDRFQRSRSTVQRHIDKILDCMQHFEKDEIRPTFSNDGADCHEYLRSRPPYLFFQNCIGAIDGTHVKCRAPEKKKALFWGRKGGVTMNIMAACDFDLCFTFASVGWQGTWHDYAIFKEIMRDEEAHQFPHPPDGKYYLVDAGYANRKGYLAPYKGCKYHLAEFRRGKREARSGNEWFNRWHSSLRSAIERCFGVWKKRWRFLTNDPTYCVDKQSRLVTASMAIHNFIRRRSTHDELWREFDWGHVEDYAFGDLPAHEDTNAQEWDAESDLYMNTFRDNLRGALDAARKYFY